MCRLSVLRTFRVFSAHFITHGLGEVDFHLWSNWESAMPGVSIAAAAELDLLLVWLNQMQNPSSRQISPVKGREPPSITFRSGPRASLSGISLLWAHK